MQFYNLNFNQRSRKRIFFLWLTFRKTLTSSKVFSIFFYSVAFFPQVVHIRNDRLVPLKLKRRFSKQLNLSSIESGFGPKGRRYSIGILLESQFWWVYWRTLSLTWILKKGGNFGTSTCFVLIQKFQLCN